jgi:predicted nucleotidyltransferase
VVSDFGLPSSLLASIQQVLARFPHVARASIYGSRAKGTFRPGSDIDLALFGDDLTADELLSIDAALDDLDMPYTLDLALFAQIENPALQSHIRRVGQEIYRAPSVSRAS